MNKNKISYAWNTILIFCLLPFLLLAVHNRPSIHDDYMDANSIIKLGAIGYIKSNYLHWSGRYTELLLKSLLNPLTYENSQLWTSVSTIAVVGFLFFSIFILCWVALGKRDVLQTSLLLMIILLCGLNDVGSFLYWYGGYTAYTFGVIFSVFFISFLCKLRISNSLYHLLACVIFIVLAIGSYEVVMIAVLWISLTNVVYSIMRSKGVKYSLVLGVVSVISAVFVVFAPGNYARIAGISTEAADMSIFRVALSACKSIFFAAEAIVSWLNSVLLLIGMVLVLQILCKNGTIKRVNFNSNPVVIFFWLFFGLSLSVFPSVVAYQTVWLHSWQGVYCFFIVGWLIVIVSVFSYFDHKYDLQKVLISTNALWFTRGLFVIIVFMSSSSNVHIAYWDLFYLSGYEDRVENRISAMREAARENKVPNLQPLFSNSDKYMIPKMLYTEEYNEGDAHAFAAYYGVDSVIVNRCHLQ